MWAVAMRLQVHGALEGWASLETQRFAEAVGFANSANEEWLAR